MLVDNSQSMHMHTTKYHTLPQQWATPPNAAWRKKRQNGHSTISKVNNRSWVSTQDLLVSKKCMPRRTVPLGRLHRPVLITIAALSLLKRRVKYVLPVHSSVYYIALTVAVDFGSYIRFYFFLFFTTIITPLILLSCTGDASSNVSRQTNGNERIHAVYEWKATEYVFNLHHNYGDHESSEEHNGDAQDIWAVRRRWRCRGFTDAEIDFLCVECGVAGNWHV